MTVRWGILSTAGINTKVLAGARASDRVDVAAVASRDSARAAAYAHEHGIGRAFGSYQELVDDPEIEAVYISLPNSLHVEWTIRALEAGKHVLCEKPLTCRPAEAEAVFDEAARTGRLLMEAFMWRHHPQTERLLSLIGEGAIGRVRHIRGAFSYLASDPRDIRLSAELEGGSLMDVGCYCVNAARLLAGEPERVVAEQVTSPAGVDIRFAGTLRFASGVTAQFDSGLDDADRSALEVVGTHGTITIDDPWHCVHPLIRLQRDDGSGTEDIPIAGADPYRLELENLSDAIRGRAEALLGRADAVGQARSIDALLRSAASGAAVSLPAG